MICQKTNQTWRRSWSAFKLSTILSISTGGVAAKNSSAACVFTSCATCRQWTSASFEPPLLPDANLVPKTRCPRASLRGTTSATSLDVCGDFTPHLSIRHAPTENTHLRPELKNTRFHQGNSHEVWIQRSAGKLITISVVKVAFQLSDQGFQVVYLLRLGGRHDGLEIPSSGLNRTGP